MKLVNGFIVREPKQPKYHGLMGWDKRTAEIESAGRINDFVNRFISYRHSYKLAEIDSVGRINNIVNSILYNQRLKSRRTDHFEEGLRFAIGAFDNRAREVLVEDMFGAFDYSDSDVIDLDLTGEEVNEEASFYTSYDTSSLSDDFALASDAPLSALPLSVPLSNSKVSGGSNSGVSNTNDDGTDDDYINDVMNNVKPSFWMYAKIVAANALFIGVPLIIYALAGECSSTDDGTEDSSNINYSPYDRDAGTSQDVLNDLVGSDAGLSENLSDVFDAPLERRNESEDGSAVGDSLGGRGDGNNSDGNNNQNDNENGSGQIYSHAQYMQAFRQTLCDYLFELDEESRTTVVDLKLMVCDDELVINEIIEQVVREHLSPYRSFLFSKLPQGDANSLMILGNDQTTIREFWREHYSEILGDQDITSYCGNYADIILNTAGCGVSGGDNNNNSGGFDGI